MPDVTTVTSTSRSAEAARRFENEIMSYGCDAGAILPAALLDPGSATLQVYCAALQLFRTTRDGNRRATPHIEAARRHVGTDNRELDLIAAVEAWSNGNFVRAGDVLASLVARSPHDLFAVKLLQYMQFARGDAHGMLIAIESVISHHRDDARAHAMHAFALDQCGRSRGAEIAARRALASAPDPWAHHALAHVMDAQERHVEGSRWMREHADDWARCTSFLYTHNWWHAALFDLALGDAESALALYDERVWAVRKDYAQDQINAISLLARLELSRVDVGTRWEEIAAQVRPRCDDAVDAFLDMHYVYALARVGDVTSIRSLLAARRDAVAPDPLQARIALTAIAGVAAFAAGRLAEAHVHLDMVAPELYRLGGSTVQRALFAQLCLAARRSGVPVRLAA